MVGDDGLWSVLEIQFSKVHKWIDRIFPSSTQLRSRAGDDLPLAGFAEFTFEIEEATEEFFNLCCCILPLFQYVTPPIGKNRNLGKDFKFIHKLGSLNKFIPISQRNGGGGGNKMKSFSYQL